MPLRFSFDYPWRLASPSIEVEPSFQNIAKTLIRQNFRTTSSRKRATRIDAGAIQVRDARIHAASQ